jgi:hypothetical protein
MRREHTIGVWVKEPQEGEIIVDNKLRSYSGKLVQVFKVLRSRPACMVAQGGK